MNIDWNGDLEVKVWDKERQPTNGWTDVVKIEKTGGNFWVYYVAADGEPNFWMACDDGTMYAGKPFGQVRNKKVESIDWTKDLEYKVWGATLEKMNHGWENVGKVVANSDSTYQVYNANKDIYCCHVFPNGKILKLSSGEQIGQVRNKKKTNPIAKVVSQSVWYIENPKPSNLATFYFDKQGDKYTLTGWKNVMTLDEIKTKYSKYVFDEYFFAFGLHAFYQEKNSKYGIYMHNNRENALNYRIGDTFQKDDYLIFIKALKQAGKRLSTIIKDSKKVEKIEVVI